MLFRSGKVSTAPTTGDEDNAAETTIGNSTLTQLHDDDKENIDSISPKTAAVRRNVQKDPLTTVTNNSTKSNQYKRFSLLTFYQNIPGPTAPGNYVSNSVHSIAEDPTPDESSIKPVTEELESTGLILPISKTSSKPISPQVTTSIKSSSPTPIPQRTVPKSTVTSTSSNSSISPAQKQKRTYSTNLNNSNTSTQHSKQKPVRKPLEPSNVKSERRISSIHTQADKSDKVEKETSTARKVMDFFKRRSMRI